MRIINTFCFTAALLAYGCSSQSPSSPSQNQPTTSTLNGRVVTNGNPVPSANVVLHPTFSNLLPDTRAISDVDGTFSAINLHTGQYAVEAGKTGFSTFSSTITVPFSGTYVIPLTAQPLNLSVSPTTKNIGNVVTCRGGTFSFPIVVNASSSQLPWKTTVPQGSGTNNGLFVNDFVASVSPGAAFGSATSTVSMTIKPFSSGPYRCVDNPNGAAVNLFLTSFAVVWNDETNTTHNTFVTVSWNRGAYSLQ